MLLRERFEITRPPEQMEIALVRAALDHPALLDAHEEAVLRTALSLARMYKVRHDGHDVGVGAWLDPFRLESRSGWGRCWGGRSPGPRSCRT